MAPVHKQPPEERKRELTVGKKNTRARIAKAKPEAPRRRQRRLRRRHAGRAEVGQQPHQVLYQFQRPTQPTEVIGLLLLQQMWMQM